MVSQYAVSIYGGERKERRSAPWDNVLILFCEKCILCMLMLSIQLRFQDH